MSDQAIDLRKIVVRPIRAHERGAWEAQMAEHHYLGHGRMCGEQMRYVAEVDGTWVALLGWQSAALKLRHREAWIGWTREQVRQRRHLVAANARFLVLPECDVPNLASRCLALNLARLSRDWQEKHGHPILVAETFVVRGRYRGTCYLACGWEEVGQTRGCARIPGGYRRHGEVKTLLMREVEPAGRARLCSADPLVWDRRIGCFDAVRQPGFFAEQDGLAGFLDRLVEDPRKPNGVRFSPGCILRLAVAAVMAGATSVKGIARWARALPEDLARRFGCFYNKRHGRYLAPCVGTFRYFLQDVDADAVDRAVIAWLAHIGITARETTVAIDGKTRCRGIAVDGKPVQLVSAFLHRVALPLRTHAVAASTNETVTARALLADIDLRDALVTADAAHTNVETALLIRQKGATSSCRSKATSPLSSLPSRRSTGPQDASMTRASNAATDATNVASCAS